MAPPDPDPWAAPFAEPVIFELIRLPGSLDTPARCSISRRTICCAPLSPRTFFDLAVTSDVGMIPLIGERIYPWGTAQGQARRLRRSHLPPVRWHTRQPALVPCAGQSRPGRKLGNIFAWAALPPTSKPIVYDRCMALRHPGRKVSKIVPKASLIENEALIARAKRDFGASPLRAPSVETSADDAGQHTVIVTTMKNEGPFILEWIAYHRAIGVDDFLVYTNDCTDGTDDMLKLLDQHGIVQHRENPFRSTTQKPQHAALAAADDEVLVTSANWGRLHRRRRVHQHSRRERDAAGSVRSDRRRQSYFNDLAVVRKFRPARLRRQPDHRPIRPLRTAGYPQAASGLGLQNPVPQYRRCSRNSAYIAPRG